MFEDHPHWKQNVVGKECIDSANVIDEKSFNFNIN